MSGRRKTTWRRAVLRSWGTGQAVGSRFQEVQVTVTLMEPEAQRGRLVVVSLPVSEARILAEGLVRNADHVQEMNTPVKILDRFPEA